MWHQSSSTKCRTECHTKLVKSDDTCLPLPFYVLEGGAALLCSVVLYCAVLYYVMLCCHRCKQGLQTLLDTGVQSTPRNSIGSEEASSS